MKGISIHLTDQCNQSCKFCVVDSYQERKESVNLKIIKRFLEENQNRGYEVVNIHGGEATLIPEFIEILELIKKLNYPEVSLQTNGKNLSDYEFTKQLYDLNVKTFVISFHHIDKEEVADLADVDKTWLTNIVQGIKNAKKVGAKVRTNTVIYKNNLNILNNIFEYLIKDLEVDHINISAIHPAGRAYKNFEDVVPSYTDISKLVKESIDYTSSLGAHVTIEGFPPCLISGYENYIVDWYTVDYKLLYHNFILNSYADFMAGSTKVVGEVCKGCAYENSRLCGGIYKEYIEKVGWDEFTHKVTAQ